MSDIPKGVYKGRVIPGSEQYGTTSGGHDQIVLDLEVPELGRQLSTFLVFSDASAPYAMDRLRACGWKGDDLSNLQGIDANEVDVKVDYREYQGKQQLDVQIMTSGGRVQLKEKMNDAGKRAFAAKFKSLAKTKPAIAGGADPAAEFPHGNQATGTGGKRDLF